MIIKTNSAIRFLVSTLLLYSLHLFYSSPVYGICGDIDGNSRFEILDALYLSKMDVSFTTPQIQTSDLADAINICANSDLNRSGDVDIVDALVVARASAGIPQPPSFFNCPTPTEIWNGDENFPQKCAEAIWSGPPTCFIAPVRASCYDVDVDIYVLSSTPQIFDIVFEYLLGTWWEAIPMPTSQNPMLQSSSPQHIVFSWDLFSDLWLRQGYSVVPLAGWGVRVSLKDPVTGITVNSCDNVYNLNVPPPPRGSFPCSTP